MWILYATNITKDYEEGTTRIYGLFTTKKKAVEAIQNTFTEWKQAMENNKVEFWKSSENGPGDPIYALAIFDKELSEKAMVDRFQLVEVTVDKTGLRILN